jgi:hypothetical protein
MFSLALCMLDIFIQLLSLAHLCISVATCNLQLQHDTFLSLLPCGLTIYKL